MLTTIPFSGFYQSVHDQELEQTLQQMFTDRATDFCRNKALERYVYDRCDWKQVFVEYARTYTEAFADEFEIASLKFESLESPREYNFMTDRIFATISEEDVGALYLRVDRRDLDEAARQRFTSRDGFSSFYSPDVTAWSDVRDWDHNQVGTLLVAVAGDSFDELREYDLMENVISNGCVESWIASATPNIERAYRIHAYLEKRHERTRA